MLSAALSKAHQEVAAFVEQRMAAGEQVPQNLTKGLDALQKLERAFREDRWCWPDWIGAAGIDVGAKAKNIVEQVKAAAQAHESHPA
ncbi:MAG: hypothetical protein GWN66_03225, partial [Pseudomonas stutzeri]|nr:hypothetical protein [Stutzerimonas stutzeri]